MTADELDTAALRACYSLPCAHDGHPVYRDFSAALGEIDRLRADLGIARELVAHWQRLYLEADRERVELSAGRAAGGVQPAPAAPSPHRHDPGWCEFGGGWACQHCRDKQALEAAAGSTDQPPSSVANDWCVPCMAWHPKGIDCSG